MAITTETFKINAGWGKTDIIQQMDDAIGWLGWHGGEKSGFVVGLGTAIGGGDTNAADEYHDVFFQILTTNLNFYAIEPALNGLVHIGQKFFKGEI